MKMTNEEQTANRALILASQSPRRVELMREAGFEFEMVVPEVKEAHDATISPEALTVENARLKAVAVAQMKPEALVIGADTLVYLDGEPLGKPKDHAEALQMLRRLSGRAHEVCTGVYLAWSGGNKGKGFHVISNVIFNDLSDEVISAYHAQVNPLDKAGAYGIQECSEMILSGYEGSWTNVMGLPMERLAEELAALGFVSAR
jgi:septum formation protein